MRRTNWRLVITGGVLAVAAIGFFLYMLGIAPASNDPKMLMQTVGQVAGIGAAVGIVLIVFGLKGKKPA